MYYINPKTTEASALEKYRFATEDSLQELLASNPSILLSNQELEIPPFEEAIAIREYPTSRGPVDIVYITENGDIALVETKLLKNPEAHRTVVAQAIDYAKAFSEEDINSIKDQIRKRNLQYPNKGGDYLDAVINKNIKSGNFQVLIVGDEVHPNILGMLDAIQSAPHLAFSLSAISLNPFSLDEGGLVLFPKVETRTIEVERSVISIQISKDDEIKIESSAPEKRNKGNKPKISREEFLDNIERAEFVSPIKRLWRETERLGGTIDWGTVGFSAGYRVNGKRISLIWVYDRLLNILTRKVRNAYTNISDKQYETYLNTLKKSEYIYEDIIVSNKSEVRYDKISLRDFELVIEATLDLMKATMDSGE